ncbi:MAG: hypothetical protein IPP96_06715 [Chitinophagaceae bacterium]|nr:hypothetical protein [Chitinophagaceae bacterium]
MKTKILLLFMIVTGLTSFAQPKPNNVDLGVFPNGIKRGVTQAMVPTLILH